MAHQLDIFCRLVEWLLFAIVCGCSLWLTFLAAGFEPVSA